MSYTDLPPCAWCGLPLAEHRSGNSHHKYVKPMKGKEREAMTKMRDEKGRYVKSSALRLDQYACIAAALVFVIAVGHLALWPPMVVVPAPPPPPRVITVPAEPIDWEKVAAWQDARDRALLKDVSKAFQRMLDRNEAINQPQFSRQ